LNIQNKQINHKAKQQTMSNGDQCMSSSLVSEKLDKRHLINLSTGN